MRPDLGKRCDFHDTVGTTGLEPGTSTVSWPRHSETKRTVTGRLLCEHRHYARLRDLCRLLCKRPEDVEGLVNLAFSSLFELTREKPLIEKSAWPYLSAVAGFRARDRRKVGGITRVPKNRSVVLRGIDDVLLAQLSKRQDLPSSADPADHESAADLLMELRSRMKGILSDKDFDFLSVVGELGADGFDQSEIAKRLGMPASTLRSRSTRVRKRAQDGE